MCAYGKHLLYMKLNNTEAPLYQKPVCLCAWEDLFPSSVITQMNTKDTIYTASLLNDIVYYIYFSYRNNVSVCGLLFFFVLDAGTEQTIQS